MTIDPTKTDCYQLLIGLIAPRPIAWVTTISPAGVVNLAPFSFFNLFGDDPPIVAFSPCRKADGSKKDTLRNLEANGEFVLNIVTRALAEQVNLTSMALPHDQSELSLVDLLTSPSEVVQPPRVLAAPAHLECTVRQILSFGDHPGASTLVIGEVLRLHVREEFLNSDGIPDPRKLELVGRMGGNYWCETSRLFEQRRPDSIRTSSGLE